MKYFLVLVAHVLFVLALQIWMDRKAPRGAISSRFRFTCIAVAVCVAGYVWFVSEPTLMLFGDFLEVYYQAGAIVLRDAQGLSAFMDGVHAYTNIPVIAYVFLPFALLDPAVAAWVFWAIGLLLAIWSWWLVCRVADLDDRESMLLLILFAANGALVNSLREGNLSHMVFAALALGLLLIRRGKHIAGGISLGIAVAMKPPLALLVPFLAVRRNWTAAFAAGSVVGAIFLLSFLVLGWDVHVHWYQVCIQPLGRSPIPAFNAQSIASFVARLEDGAAGRYEWDGYMLSAAGKTWSNIGNAIFSGIALLVLLYRRFKEPKVRMEGEGFSVIAPEFALVVALLTITSPLSWTHYYTWLLLCIALLIKSDAFPNRWPNAVRLRYIAVAVLSLPLVPVQFHNATLDEAYVKVGMSNLLWGGILAFVLLVLIVAYGSRADRQQPPTVDSATR